MNIKNWKKILNLIKKEISKVLINEIERNYKGKSDENKENEKFKKWNKKMKTYQ